MNKGASNGGIGVGTLIFLVLVILKATDKIVMSWFWVLTSIIWAPVLIGIALIIIFSVLGFISKIIKY